MEKTVQASIEFAMEAHRGQTDKKGIPYIEHPVRVAVKVMERTHDVKFFIVGILHDVVEDTDKTKEDIREILVLHQELDYFAVDSIINAVGHLTHPKGQPYMEYIRRVKRNTMAREVKLADIEDNLGRIDGLPMPTKARLLGKYIPALGVLKGHDT